MSDWEGASPTNKVEVAKDVEEETDDTSPVYSPDISSDESEDDANETVDQVHASDTFVPSRLTRAEFLKLATANVEAESQSTFEEHDDSDEDDEVVEQMDAEGLQSFAERLLKDPGWLPYDPNNIVNKKRLQIEEILLRRKRNSNRSLSIEEAGRLLVPITPWKLKTGIVSEEDKKILSANLNRLNEQRIQLLEENEEMIKKLTGAIEPEAPHSSSLFVENPPQSETLKCHPYSVRSQEPLEGNSSDIKKSKQQRAIVQSKLAISMKKSTKPSSRPIMRTLLRDVKAKVNTNLAGSRAAGLDQLGLRDRPSTVKTTMKEKVNQVPEPKSIEEGPIPKPVVDSREVQVRLSSEDSSEEERKNTLKVVKIQSPFQNDKAKCNETEARSYFKEIGDAVKSLNDTWIIQYHGQEPVLDNLYARISEENKFEMLKLEMDKRTMLIEANNAFLADTVSNKFIESCEEYYTLKETRAPSDAQAELEWDRSNIENMFDFKILMNDIFYIFLEKLKTGLTLPNLYMKGVKIPRRRKMVIDMTAAVIRISKRNIPDGQLELFKEFVGRGMTETWRFFNHQPITYGDGLGFLPSRSLSCETFQTLLAKILHVKCGEQSKYGMIMWTEITELMDLFPDARFDNSKLNPLLATIMLRVSKIVEHLFIPICPDGMVPYSVAKVDIKFKKISLYVSEQPKRSFRDWAANHPDRQLMGYHLEFVKALVEFIVPAEWCHSDISGWKWPWDDYFILQPSVEISRNVSLGAIYSCMWLESTLASVSSDAEYQFIADPDTLTDGDPRIKYLKMLNDMFN